MNLGNSGRWVEPEAGFLEIKIQAAMKRKKSPILQVEIHTNTLVFRFFPKSRTNLHILAWFHIALIFEVFSLVKFLR